MPKKFSPPRTPPPAPQVEPSSAPLIQEDDEDDLEATKERPAVGARPRAAAAKPQHKPQRQRDPQGEEPQPQAAAAVAGEERIGIELLNGPDDGTITTFEQPVILLGRDPDRSHQSLALSDEQRKDIGLLNVTSDPKLSRTHLALTFHDGRWWAHDLSSTNGSFLGDGRERLGDEERELSLSQIILVGDTRIRLVAPGAPQADQP